MDHDALPTVLAPGIAVLRAENPSEMTLDGTNTYLVFDPALNELRPGTPVMVIDPGPQLEAHLTALAAYRVTLILSTHRHADHTQGIDALVQLTGAPARAWLAEHCRAATPLRENELVQAAGTQLRVLSTPGHTSDSVCFVRTGAPEHLFTGDTVLGRGTTILDYPDGTLRDYLNTLERLLSLPDMPLHPGHGEQQSGSLRLLEGYRLHREDRLNQVRTALDRLEWAGETPTPSTLLGLVYPDLDPRLVGAATKSLEAQLHYLSSNP